MTARESDRQPAGQITVEINHQQSRCPVDVDRIRQAVTNVLAGEGISSALVSVAVVDDPAIHQLNRRYLQHDYPTDVLSFVLEQTRQHLEGEVIVSSDAASRCCGDYGWQAADELILYVVHGTLHLAGHDDQSTKSRGIMRQREQYYLEQLGLIMANENTNRFSPPTGRPDNQPQSGRQETS